MLLDLNDHDEDCDCTYKLRMSTSLSVGAAAAAAATGVADPAVSVIVAGAEAITEETADAKEALAELDS